MEMKYKIINKETGEVFTELKGYLLNSRGTVETIILPDNTHVSAREYTFRKFLEVIDGKDVYDRDRARVQLTKQVYDSEEEEDVDGEVTIITGEFRELYEEGLYYLVDDETDEVITYNSLKPRILSFL